MARLLREISRVESVREDLKRTFEMSPDWHFPMLDLPINPVLTSLIDSRNVLVEKPYPSGIEPRTEIGKLTLDASSKTDNVVRYAHSMCSDAELYFKKAFTDVKKAESRMVNHNGYLFPVVLIINDNHEAIGIQKNFGYVSTINIRESREMPGPPGSIYFQNNVYSIRKTAAEAKLIAPGIGVVGRDSVGPFRFARFSSFCLDEKLLRKIAGRAFISGGMQKGNMQEFTSSTDLFMKNIH